MTKSSAIAQLRNRYDPNVNGVQVVGGSNPLTPISVSKHFVNILLTFSASTTLGLRKSSKR